MTIGSKKREKGCTCISGFTLYFIKKTKYIYCIKYVCSIYIVKDESNYRVKKFK